MRYLISAALIAFAATASAAPDYRTIRMEISVDRPASEVWARVGRYCDISQWLDVECKIVAGDGGIGTVRSLNNGRVLEILVGKTDLSYGYTQPPPAKGGFYNLYHGFVEAKPVTRSTSKIIYTLFYDVSDKPDEAAKQADMTQRRKRFEAALQKMKQIAER
ncbi:MAG TPA: SRPBCC family protein [Steroidobacteraceae bacterium]|nr:SRPBCC family protein [Steroidobacteraceae bacterium]